MINNIINFLKLIRWFHELLAILPFAALYYVIHYFAQLTNSSCSLSGSNFLVLCLGVLLLMMVGFIWNDIIDRDIDVINKPNTHVVGRTISLMRCKQLFVITTVLTIAISVYISCYLFKEWAYISTAVYILSIMYSLYFKKMPLVGNVVIAGLASFIPIVLLFFAKDCIAIIANEQITTLVYLYAVFPFLIIIPRELSLDISDIEGDIACGCKTLPILIGAKRSKIVVVLLISLTIVLSLIVSYHYNYLTSTFLLVDALLLYYIYKLYSTTTREQYIKIGVMLWITMIVGLIGFVIVTIK